MGLLQREQVLRLRAKWTTRLGVVVMVLLGFPFYSFAWQLFFLNRRGLEITGLVWFGAVMIFVGLALVYANFFIDKAADGVHSKWEKECWTPMSIAEALRKRPFAPADLTQASRTVLEHLLLESTGPYNHKVFMDAVRSTDHDGYHGLFGAFELVSPRSNVLQRAGVLWDFTPEIRQEVFDYWRVQEGGSRNDNGDPAIGVRVVSA